MKWAQILLMVIAMPATVCAQRAGFPSTAPMPATPLTTAQVPANQPSTNMVPLRPTGPSTYSPSPTYPAQQPYAAQPYPAQPYQAQPYGASNGAAPVYPPNGGGYQPTYPSSSLGVPSLNQSFDPYAKQNAGPSLFPSGPTGSGNASILPGMFGSGTVMGQPSSYSGFGPNTQVLPPPDVSYPSTIYPNQTPRPCSRTVS